MKKIEQATGITSEASVIDAYSTAMHLAEEKRKQTWYAEAIIEYRNAIRQAEGLRSRARIAEALYFIGICEVRLTNLESALASFREARNLFQRSRNRERVADCYGNETYVHRMRADYKTAHQLAQKALAIYEKTDNKTRAAMIHQNIGAIYIEQKRPHKAAASMRLAFQIMTEVGNYEFANNVRIDLAKVIYSNDEVDESLEMLDQVIQEATNRNLTVQLAQALFTRGMMLPTLLRYEEAINDLVVATEHFHYLGDKRFEVLALTNLGSIRKLKGDNETARVDLERAILLSKEIKLPLLEHYAIRASAMVNHRRNFHEAATTQIESTIAYFHELGNPREENFSVFLRGLWNAELGLKAKAVVDFDRALTFCLRNPCHALSVETFFSV
ncbi:MAG: tetratricopeptide repeat protein, partial [bacterium]|nr:tetratricopeptide repeat protein [bacterium]